MQSARRRVFQSLVSLSSPSSSLSSSSSSHIARGSLETLTKLSSNGALAAPWAANQTRSFKVHGSDVRPGNVIERNGRFYEVLKAQHTQQGRGGATIQAELRDVDSGNKMSQRFRTDESIEKVFVEQKAVTYLYQDGDAIVLMDSKTFEQVEVSSKLLGKAAVYLKEDVPVTLHVYDERVMSATIPPKVTCTVVDAQRTTKGLTAAAQYKKVVLDNGLTVSVPAFIKPGDEIIVSTIDDTYVTRWHELSALTEPSSVHGVNFDPCSITMITKPANSGQSRAGMKDTNNCMTFIKKLQIRNTIAAKHLFFEELDF